MKRAILIFVCACLVATLGCSAIIGKEDTLTYQGLSMRFVETLRNEASLRGESLKERATNTNRATTLQQPNGVFADAFRVYVTDASPSPRVFVFDRGLSKVNILDSVLPREVKLVAPGGITVDAGQTIWVSDSAQGRVFGYDPNGKLLFIIGQMGELSYPVGLARDIRNNRLYVADAHAHRVKVFSTNGTRLFEIGAGTTREEEFKFPGAIALDREGNLYVLDTLSRRIQVYDGSGKFLKGFGLAGSVPGLAVKPSGIAVDSDGHLYVTDAASNNVLIFDRNGMFLFTWGATGGLIGEFWTPAGIFIDDRDYIYIADRTNGRVQTFQYIK